MNKMAKFEIKDAKVTKLENGNVLFERTFVEELTSEEYEKFENNTKMSHIGAKNNVERLKAQIAAEPILDDELKALSDKHKKAMEAASIQHSIDEAKVKLKEMEIQVQIARAGQDAIDLANSKNEGN